MQVGKDLLQHALGPPIGIGDLSLGTVLRDGDLCRITVDSGRGTEYDVFDAVATHLVAENECPGQIVVIVFQRFMYGLAYCFQARKMDHGVNDS